MNLDQTAPKKVWSGFTLFTMKTYKVHQQMREQTTVVVNSGIWVNPYLVLKIVVCIQMCSIALLQWNQTLWILIRLLLRKQSDQDSYCLQWRLHKISRWEQMWIVVKTVICRIYSKHLVLLFSWKQALWSGSILFTVKTAKVNQQTRKDKTLFWVTGKQLRFVLLFFRSNSVLSSITRWQTYIIEKIKIVK